MTNRDERKDDNSLGAGMPLWLRVLLISTFLLSIVVFTASTTRADKSTLSFTILHTNDLHAHDESFVDHGRQVGGVARMAHIIRALKAKDPTTLYIDAGDIFQGTPLYTLYHGEVEVNDLNKMGCDIYTIGNHEFDDGPQNLARQLSKGKFTIISSNIDASKVPELQKLIQPSVVRTIDGDKVAFIGAVVPDLEQVSLTTGGVKVKSAFDKDHPQEWMKPISDEVNRLKSEGINKIILVTHVGVEMDRDLAEALPDVDAIVGGHSHTRLDKPIVVDHPDGSCCYIVQTGCYGRALGKMDLTFDKEGHLVKSETRDELINISPSIPEEGDIKDYIAKEVKPLLPLRNKIAGFAERDFDNRFNNYAWDSSIGDLICDALVYEGKSYGASIAFQNRGGIRGRIEEGPITLEKVQEVLPFDNRVTFATVSGASILKNLKYSVSGSLGAKFLDEHGLKVAYDPTKPREDRLVFALVQDASGEWKPIDPDGKYKIAINNYTFNGGEGYDFSSAATNVRNQKDRLSDALSHYLISNPKVKPEPPSRIVPVTAGILSLKQKTLKVTGTQPGSRLTLVSGDGKGVSSIQGFIDVPLSNPKIITSDAVSDGTGEYSWPTSAASDAKYVAVVIRPPKSSHGHRGPTVISYPVELSQ